MRLLLMSENQYDNFKQGIKNDVNEIGASLLLVGGLMLLICVLLASLVVVIHSQSMSSSTKTISIVGLTLFGGLMIFNKKFLLFILKAWIILLVAAVILPIFGLSFYFFYMAFKG
jgi:hypothetical protein